MTVIGLSNLNSSIDASHQAQQRDWLALWANRELGADVFVTGKLAHQRRSSKSGIAANTLVCLVIIGTSVGGILAASGQPWFWVQVAGTLVLAIACAMAVADFATTRPNAQQELAEFSQGALSRTNQVATKATEI